LVHSVTLFDRQVTQGEVHAAQAFAAFTADPAPQILQMVLLAQ
jgi:hypothetical protein